MSSLSPTSSSSGGGLHANRMRAYESGAKHGAELPKVLQKEAWRVPLEYPLPFFASAVLGFAVSVCTFLVIKATNSVTLKVLGTARSAGLVVWSAMVLGERITPIELGGYTLSLCAFGAYNYFKMQGK